MTKTATAVFAVLVLAGCGGSRSLPTGAAAVDPHEIAVEAFVVRWTQVKGLEPIPVSFVPNVQVAFGLSAPASGFVPCGERRIYFDSGQIKRQAPDWFLAWVAAHEVGHVYYRDCSSSLDIEVRADAFANELTGQDWWPHGGRQ